MTTLLSYLLRQLLLLEASADQFPQIDIAGNAFNKKCTSEIKCKYKTPNPIDGGSSRGCLILGCGTISIADMVGVL